MRIALDSNVLVAAFATRGLCADVLRVVLAEHELLVVPRVRSEVERALARKIRLPSGEVAGAMSFLAAFEVEAQPSVRVLELRDPDDEHVVAEAVAAGAELLVTGDGDLLEASGRSPIEILSPRAFWESLRSPG